MSFVATLASTHRTVTVLHEGQTLAEGTMAQVQSDEKVIEVYLGR
jgi:urea transport system ATP-binding protein